MGVSVDSGGGRGKGQNFDLNLVPFIDLLSVCITFLLQTAVWTSIMSLNLDQAISQPNPNDPPPPEETPPTPPLTIHIKANGIWMSRSLEWCADPLKYPEGCDILKLGDAYDWEKAKTRLQLDYDTYVDTENGIDDKADLVILVTDDGVEYQHMIAGLDLTRVIGFEKTLLGGGPAEGTDLPPPTPR